jgi:hypothetical protein
VGLISIIPLATVLLRHRPAAFVAVRVLTLSQWHTLLSIPIPLGDPVIHSISYEGYPAIERLYPPPIPSLAHGCARGLLHSDRLNDLSCGIPGIRLEEQSSSGFQRSL